MACEECVGIDGEEYYPQYGLAPHDHVVDSDGNYVATVFAGKDLYPDNFQPDPDNEKCGTWHCEFCYQGDHLVQ